MSAGTEPAGRTALITGGGSGIGRGIGLALADRGVSIGVAGDELGACQQTACDIMARGASAIPIQCDVREPDDIERAVGEVVGEWNRLDILVHSAQSFNYGPIRQLSASDVEESFRTGPMAAFLLMKAALPALRASRGLILTIASGVGIAAPPAMAAYAMAKEALRTLTRVAAVEWGPYGVRAIALCPLADSPGLDSFEKEFGIDRDAELIPHIPLERVGDPERDIGAVVAFLASDDARYISGTTMMVDGGYTYLR